MPSRHPPRPKCRVDVEGNAIADFGSHEWEDVATVLTIHFRFSYSRNASANARRHGPSTCFAVLAFASATAL
jgi:hypothetical protein